MQLTIGNFIIDATPSMLFIGNPNGTAMFIGRRAVPCWSMIRDADNAEVWAGRWYVVLSHPQRAA